jgi:peptidyl-dipeptidase Dcp
MFETAATIMPGGGRGQRACQADPVTVPSLPPDGTSAGLAPDNPFARPSDLPFGLPPFDRIRVEHFRPAFEAGMAEHGAQVEAIATAPDAPTFVNTVEALECSGRLLDRVAAVFFNLTSSHVEPALADLEAEMAPLLAAHADAVRLDPRLYARLAAVHEARDGLALDAEQRRLLERYHLDLVRAGAALDEASQQRLRAINAELSTLAAEFKRRLLADTTELALHLTDVAELDGLSDGELAAASEAAATRGLDGYLITLALPTAQPALARLRNRAVRQRLHTASVTRGLRGTANDTRELLTRTVALRAERAGLLGYADHAAYVVADQTAGSLDAVTTMLGGLVAPAVANAMTEAAVLEALLVADGEIAPLQPWDWAHYADRVRRDRYQVDTAALRPYFELRRLVEDGVFYAANALYGLGFARRFDLAAYHPDVETYDVTGPDGAPLGLFLADWYARDSKRGGAWMSSFVDQSRLLGTGPVIVINLNIPRPPAGEPTLLTLDEIRTAFHEFGHVLHGLLSDVVYPRLSGTSVPRDFVEFPSQVNEMWAWEPAVLARYAVHHETGEPLAPERVRALRAAQVYGEGQATTAYLAAALLDLEWHRRCADDEPVPAAAVEEFETAALLRNGICVPLVPPRYRSSYFAHVFAGGYSAAYYSYIWSEVLDADTVEWFREQGGLQRSAGETFARELLSRGGARDPMEAFEAVRGRPPVIDPLLARRGLTPG